MRGDSLLPFVELLVGRRRARLALADAVRSAIGLHARRHPEIGPDLRTTIKARFLRRTLDGVPVEEARSAAERLVPWVRWIGPIRDALLRHADEGRHVVVATGALSLYVPRLLDGLPVAALLATEVEAEGGVLTGRMPRGNCVRAVKAERVREHLAAQGAPGPVWGYGNRPSDLPMLALVDHPTVVP